MASIHELSALAAEEHPELQPMPCAEVHDAHDAHDVRTARAMWSAGWTQATLQQAAPPFVRPSTQPVRHATTAPVDWLVHWLVRSAAREVHGAGGTDWSLAAVPWESSFEWRLEWTRTSADAARAAASAALATSTLFTAACSAARAASSPLCVSAQPMAFASSFSAARVTEPARRSSASAAFSAASLVPSSAASPPPPSAPAQLLDARSTIERMHAHAAVGADEGLIASKAIVLALA